MNYRSLKAEFPELSQELLSLLHREGMNELADQVSQLRIFDRCRCGDDCCATIYVLPPPEGKWRGKIECVELGHDEELMVLDIVDGQISGIEIMHREEVRTKLIRLLP